MKKLILVASIFVAGVVSAKTVTPKNGEKETAKCSNTEIQKISEKVELKAKKLDPFYAYTSCGVAAVTYQNWTTEQGQIWANMIEANYCGHGYN